MFFRTLFLIVIVIGLGYSQTKITVNGGNLRPQDTFSPSYTTPESLKDDCPLLTEELERLPSVFLKESGAGEGHLSFRGLSGRHTLVFLDRIPLNDLALGEVNFSQFLSGSVQPQSVIPGANSVLYGERALGGVVLLETPFNKKSDKYVHGEYGSFESAYGHASIQEKGSDSRFILHGEGDRSSGISQNDRTRMIGEKNKYGRLGAAAVFQKGTTTHQIKLKVRVMESSGKYDDNSNSSLKPQGTKNFKMILVGAEGKIDVRNLSHKLNLFLNETDTKDESLYGKFSSDTTLVGGHYEGSLHWTKHSTLKLLTDIRQNIYKSQGNFQKTGTDWGIGLQHTHSFNSNWSGEIGGRLDENHKFGSYGTYSLGLAYKLNLTTLRGSLKTGFAAPTFYELYANTVFHQANPALKPETARTTDFAIQQDFLQKKATFLILYFQTEVKNLILNSGRTTTNSSSTTHLSGVETSLSLKPNESWSFDFNYMVTQKTAINIGFPEQKGAFGATWKFHEDWNLNNQVIYIGKRQDPLLKAPLDTYFSMKISLDYNISSNSKVYIRIENLLNSNCVQTYGYRSAKRTFYVGSSLYF